MQMWMSSGSPGPMPQTEGPPYLDSRVVPEHLCMWFQPVALYRRRIDSTELNRPHVAEHIMALGIFIWRPPRDYLNMFMYSPHMLIPHDMQDAQEDAIRKWVPPHFETLKGCPSRGWIHTGCQVGKRFNVVLIRRERWGTLKGYSLWGQQYLHIVSESNKPRRMRVVLTVTYVQIHAFCTGSKKQDLTN